MTTSAQTMVIGVFRDRTLAEQAIDELRQTGWSNDQIHLIGQRTGGLLSSLKGAFNTSSASDEFMPDDPIFQGLSDEQRDQYQHAFEQGSFIVAVSAATHSLEVRDTLHRYGAMNVLLPSSQGKERIISLRREEVGVQKNTVVIGELRIHKRIITENQTFTVPVTREEVTIERLPLSPDPTQSSAQTLPASLHYPGSTQAQEGASVQPSSGEASPAPLMSSPSPQETSPAVSTSTDQPLNTQPVDMAFVHDVLEKGGSLRILVHAEQVMLQKQSVVVEEIHVHKEVVGEIRHLSVPVHHEEAFFERHGNFQVHSNLPEGTIATDPSVPPG